MEQQEQVVRPRGFKAAWLAAGAALLFKAKGLLVLFKAVPIAKFGLTGLSMLAMIAVEAWRFGLPFAVGFVLLILIHELGHGLAMRLNHVEAGWPIFIPFMGAVISMKGQPRDRGVEAAIAYGGPLAGAAASVGVAALGIATESRLLITLAYSGMFMNLFNLIPMSPMDGGRIAQAFSRRAWIVGAVLMGGLFLLTWAPQLLIIGFMALSQLRRQQATEERELLSRVDQQTWAVRYFGLCLFLGLGVYFSQRLLGHA